MEVFHNFHVSCHVVGLHVLLTFFLDDFVTPEVCFGSNSRDT